MLELLKKSKKTIGTKQTLKAIEKGVAITVFIARDADERVTGNLIKMSRNQGVEIVYVESMKQLGKACGIEVGAATAAIIK